MTQDAARPPAGNVTEDAPAPARLQMTRESYEALRREAEAARTVERPALARRAARARLFAAPEQADQLAAVAEYDLGILARRLEQLDALLARADVLPDDPHPTDAEPGTAVVVRDEDGEEETLRLVGPLEADPSTGRVAIGSPAGRALLGTRPGARVSFGSGPDRMHVTIVAVRRGGKPDDESSALPAYG